MFRYITKAEFLSKYFIDIVTILNMTNKNHTKMVTAKISLETDAVYKKKYKDCPETNKFKDSIY